MRAKKMLPWILGGMIAVSALAWGLNTSKAAEKDMGQMNHQYMHQEMTQDGKNMTEQMDSKQMQEMMQDPAMQKKCLEMLQQPDMQSMMKDMVQKPEMQAILKDMMQKDGQFHKTMLDLVNSVEMDESHEQGAVGAATSQPAGNTEHQHQHD